jgi:hypothetical protein
MRSWCAFEQPKEEISSSRTEILVEQTRTGARTSLQSWNLVPSDCHWAVFLDDIDIDVRRYCFDSGISMLLWEWKSWLLRGKSVSEAGDFHKKGLPATPSKSLVTALSQRPIAILTAFICADSYSPGHEPISPPALSKRRRRNFWSHPRMSLGLRLRYPHATPHHS